MKETMRTIEKKVALLEMVKDMLERVEAVQHYYQELQREDENGNELEDPIWITPQDAWSVDRVEAMESIKKAILKLI